ncbi:uncharacterized protein LOC112081443 [Eutrema salsugineum]|uniref:uncharacterized protein LOC112081443 n=1 Tax=Eutrema salsugineum TaxID=72664 RepID=UPI000CED5632|nr:uncharacterized protein LOC112081443 [Eutrema salsugineum]
MQKWKNHRRVRPNSFLPGTFTQAAAQLSFSDLTLSSPSNPPVVFSSLQLGFGSSLAPALAVRQAPAKYYPLRCISILFMYFGILLALVVTSPPAQPHLRCTGVLTATPSLPHSISPLTSTVGSPPCLLATLPSRRISALKSLSPSRRLCLHKIGFEGICIGPRSVKSLIILFVQLLLIGSLRLASPPAASKPILLYLSSSSLRLLLINLGQFRGQIAYELSKVSMAKKVADPAFMSASSRTLLYFTVGSMVFQWQKECQSVQIFLKLSLKN